MTLANTFNPIMWIVTTLLLKIQNYVQENFQQQITDFIWECKKWFYKIFLLYLFVYSIYMYFIRQSLIRNLIDKKQQTKIPTPEKLCNDEKQVLKLNPIISGITWFFQSILFLILCVNIYFFYIKVTERPPVDQLQYNQYIMWSFGDLVLNFILMGCMWTQRQYLHDIFAEQQTEKDLACACPSKTIAFNPFQFAPTHN